MTQNTERQKLVCWPLFIKFIFHVAYALFVYTVYFDWIDGIDLTTLVFLCAAGFGLILLLYPELTALVAFPVFYFGLQQSSTHHAEFYFVATLWLIYVYWTRFKYQKYVQAIRLRQHQKCY